MSRCTACDGGGGGGAPDSGAAAGQQGDDGRQEPKEDGSNAPADDAFGGMTIELDGLTHVVPTGPPKRSLLLHWWRWCRQILPCRAENGAHHEDGASDGRTAAGGGGGRVILDAVSATFAPGELVAVMGASGSGKTTLLNVVTGRGSALAAIGGGDGGSASGPASGGALMYDGEPRDRLTRRRLAYVTQEVLLFDMLTVYDTLRFAAAVRLPNELSVVQRDARVAELLQELSLWDARHTRVSRTSGGERRRVAVGVALLQPYAPAVLLDEPTTGLDAAAALSLVRVLRRLAAQHGRTVVLSVHQPSAAMFREFDRLLLLNSNGQVVYFGAAAAATRHFSSLGLHVPFGYSAPDYFISLLDDSDDNGAALARRWREGSTMGSDGSPSDDGNADAASPLSRLSPLSSSSCSDGGGAAAATEPPARGLAEAGKPPAESFTSSEELRKPTERRGRGARAPRPPPEAERFASSWTQQFRALLWRALRQKQGRVLEWIRVVKHALVTVVFCVVWFRTPMTEETLFDRLGLLFFIAVYWAMASVLEGCNAFPPERAVVTQERAAGMYALSSYFMAKSIVDVPLDMLYPLGFSLVGYYIFGLNPAVRCFVCFVVIVQLLTVLAQSVGLACAAATAQLKAALVLGAVFTHFGILLSGFYANSKSLPAWLRVLQYGAYVRYAFSALILNEMSGVDSYPCGRKPTMFRGNSCPIRPQQVLEQLPVVQIGVGGNIGVMLLLVVAFRVLAYALLRGTHREHKLKRAQLDAAHAHGTRAKLRKLLLMCS